MKISGVKFSIIFSLALIVVTFLRFDLGQYFTLVNFKSHQQTFQLYYNQHNSLTMVIYFLMYIVITGLSLPGAAVMTLAAGALFGLWMGTVVVSFASSIGATLAFLVSRFLLRDSIQNKFGNKLGAINDGIRRDGAFYLFTLRLVPVFPFFVINLLMGLTPIRAAAFYVVSQLGMLPRTLVYVNGGTQLAKIDSLNGILSPGLIISFALLGIFPLIAKKLVSWIKTRRVQDQSKRSKQEIYCRSLEKGTCT